MKPVLLPLLGLILSTGLLRAAEPVSYLTDVKPIFSAHCVSCHGAVRQKANLRLDASPLIRKGSKNGPVVVPGKIGESPLLDAVMGKDRSRMPPEKEGESLTPRQISVLRAWIDQGAKMQDEPIPDDPRKHWAFQPPVRTPVPQLKGAQPGNPIDAFLAAQRAARGVTINPPADRGTLLRRVYLDLVGVPPTRDELRAFLADTAPDAYEKVVDQLLASPQHGERWGRHWMDVWRYCDAYGSGAEIRYSQPFIWRWRDWIIESLNADRGYDRMIHEMLAGDEIAPTDQKTLRATGYLARNWYKFDRNVWMQQTVEHTAQGFLGITLRCARCHDHKYDPIAQQDYYRFRAFFEPHDVRIDALPDQPDIKKDGVPRAFDAKLDTPTYLFLRGDDRAPDKSRVLAPGLPAALGAEDLAIQPVRFTGERGGPPDPAVEAARAAVRMAETSLVAARAAVEQAKSSLNTPIKDPPARPAPFLHDTFAAARPDLWKPVRGKWSHEKGRLVQKDVGLWATMATTKEHPRDFMGRVRYRTTGGATFFSVGLSFDVVGETSWQAIYTSVKGQSVQAFHRENGQEVYPAAGILPCPVALNQEITLDFAVRGDLLNVWVNGQLRIVYRLPLARRNGVFALWNLQATSEFLEVRLEALPASLPLADKLTNARPSPLAGTLKLTRADLEKAVKQAESDLVVAEKHVPVARAALTAVELKSRSTVASTGRRLALARWMTRPDHPLTTRVAVNHVWLRHFGKPLVESVANFGLAGKKPTHPALLDWLAVRFVEDGWSFKKLHRLIVTSEAYRLDSGVPKDRKNAALDPDNALLWRMNPRRMESEVVRDSLLALSGQLDRTMGGPALDETLGLSASRRRSIYFRLTTEHKMLFLELFDLASPNECYERRESVIPQQALTLTNSVLALSHARLAARTLTAPDDAVFVMAAFEHMLGRVPTREEQTLCERFLREQRELLKNTGKLTPFPPDGNAPVPPSADPVMRARENLVHVLINHNDFVTIR